jgi:hypothetical protein
MVSPDLAQVRKVWQKRFLKERAFLPQSLPASLSEAGEEESELSLHPFTQSARHAFWPIPLHLPSSPQQSLKHSPAHFVSAGEEELSSHSFTHFTTQPFSSSPLHMPSSPQQSLKHFITQFGSADASL